MKGDQLLVYLALAAALLVVILVVFGCTTQPSCRDDPRNMRCMSAAQLEQELSR